MLYVWIIIISLCALYSVLVLFFTYGIYKLSTKTVIPKTTKLNLSIVVAIRNEEDCIENMLNSIREQDYPASHFELILVNDHSADNGMLIAQEWAEKISSIRILHLPEGTKGKKQAIALGVSKAQNSTIVLTDADCVHPKLWLQEISNAYSQGVTAMVIGPTMLFPTKSVFQKMQLLEHASLSASTLGACAVGIPFMASSANLSFSRDVLGFKLDMLNPTQPSGDDVFLLHHAKKIRKGKIRCIHSPNGLVLAKCVRSLKDFLLQRARWASKATVYRDFASIAIGVIVLLFNLTLIYLMVFSFFDIFYLKMLLLAFIVKILADFLLLFPYLRRYNKISLINVFLPLQLVYPIYIVIAFGLSILNKPKWKGR